jgi:hypothetical protein
MQTVLVNVVDYEHDEYDLGIYHLRLPSVPQVVLATNWSDEDGRPFVGKTIPGVFYVSFCGGTKVPPSQPEFTIVSPGGNLSPSYVTVCGQLVEYYETPGMPLCHVLQGIVPIYALIESGLPSDGVRLGEWIKVTGGVCFGFDE